MIRKNPDSGSGGWWGLTGCPQGHRQPCQRQSRQAMPTAPRCPRQPRQILAMAVKAQVTVALVSGPGRGHQLERGARTSGARETAPGPGSQASGRRLRRCSRSSLRARRQATATLMRPSRTRARTAEDSPRCPSGTSQREAPRPPGTGRRRRAPARYAGKDGHRSASTAGTDLGRGWTAPSPVPKAGPRQAG
jgi:hypothetical protein